MADSVNKPKHYQSGGIETIDVIRAKLGDGFGYYCEGNVLKYLTRWRHKGGVEDLRKAQVYLGWLLESAEPVQPAKRDGRYDRATNTIIAHVPRVPHNVAAAMQRDMMNAAPRDPEQEDDTGAEYTVEEAR